VLAYIDTSAVVPLFLIEAHTPAMQAWVTGEGPRVILGDFTAAEFAAAVSRSLRMGHLTTSEAEAVLADFDLWRSHLEQRYTGRDDIASCERLVRDLQLKLNAPDALHLAIAMADDLPIVTFDERLAAAARSLKHRVVVPGSKG